MNSGNYNKYLMTEEWQPLSHNPPPFKPQDEYLLLEANPGDVIFFDSYVPHGSPANASNLQRRIIFLTFNKSSSGDLRNQYYTDKWSNYPPNTLSQSRSGNSFKV